MIKKAVFENDLIVGMRRELQSYDKKVAMDNLVQAGECLHSALVILEEVGLTVQANQVLSILEKIANDQNEAGPKHKPTREFPNLQVFFDSGKFSPEDLKATMSGDPKAIAKVNAAMREHGVPEHKIMELMGKNYIPSHRPSPKPGEEIVISPLPSSPSLESNNPNEEMISMRSLLASVANELGVDENFDFGGSKSNHSKEDASRYDSHNAHEKNHPKCPDCEEPMTKSETGRYFCAPCEGEKEYRGSRRKNDSHSIDEQDARGKPRKPKNPTKVHDPHTSGLTPERMVENLKHHGIVFNMADDGKADTMLDVELSDDNNLEVVDGDPSEKTFEDES